MTRVPFESQSYFDDPQSAKSYAASARSRATKVGKIVAQGLVKAGWLEGRILEAGCGAGDLAVELARGIPKAEIVGLDLSDPLLEMARSSAAQAGLADRVCFQKGDLQTMPFSDDWFDVVVSLNTLHVVQDPIAMLDEIERVLNPNGRLLLSDIKRSWVGIFMPILKTAYTLEQVKDILKSSRLRSWQVYDRFLWYGLEAHASGRFLSDQ